MQNIWKQCEWAWLAHWLTCGIYILGLVDRSHKFKEIFVMYSIKAWDLLFDCFLFLFQTFIWTYWIFMFIPPEIFSEYENNYCLHKTVPPGLSFELLLAVSSSETHCVCFCVCLRTSIVPSSDNKNQLTAILVECMCHIHSSFIKWTIYSKSSHLCVSESES